MWVQKVPGGGVLALAFAPDGRTLYTKDGGGWVSRWDVSARTGGRAFSLGRTEHRYYGGFGFAGRGRYLVAVGRPVVVLDTTTGAVRELDPRALTDYAVVTSTIAPDPFEARLLALQESGELATWDLDAWCPGPALRGPGRPVHARRFDLMPHGRALVRVNAKEDYAVYDLPTDTVVARVSPRLIHANPFGQPAPDGRTLLMYAEHRIRVWDLPTRRPRGEPVVSLHPGTITAFHPTEPVFAALDARGHPTLFGLEGAQPLRTLDFGLGAQVQCVCFAPDGLTCAVGGSNKQFAVFDVDI